MWSGSGVTRPDNKRGSVTYQEILQLRYGLLQGQMWQVVNDLPTQQQTLMQRP